MKTTIVFQFFINFGYFCFCLFNELCCFTGPFVAKFETKSEVPGLTSRDIEYCWWSLLSSLISAEVAKWQIMVDPVEKISLKRPAYLFLCVQKNRTSHESFLQFRCAVLICSFGNNMVYHLPHGLYHRGNSGPLFTENTPSYGYVNSHFKPKTVWRPSQVDNEDSYTVRRCRFMNRSLGEHVDIIYKANINWGHIPCIWYACTYHCLCSVFSERCIKIHYTTNYIGDPS